MIRLILAAPRRPKWTGALRWCEHDRWWPNEHHSFNSSCLRCRSVTRVISLARMMGVASGVVVFAFWCVCERANWSAPKVGWWVGAGRRC